MLISELFPSNYVTAADLRGQNVTLTIANCTLEELEKGKNKPVLWFIGMRKGLVLNKTNAKVIAKKYGEEITAWLNRQITIYPSECEMRGEIVACIRVKSDIAMQQMAAASAASQPAVATPAATPQPATASQTAAPTPAASNEVSF